MLPRREEFARAHGTASASATACKIVVYDGAGLFSAPRVWWMLRTFGARDVAILEGGAPAWRAEGRPWTDEPTVRRPAVFTPRLNHGAVADADGVQACAGHGARPRLWMHGPPSASAARLRSPVPACAAGTCRAASTCLRRNRRRWTPKAARRTSELQFAAAGVDVDRPIVTSCGSGVSAAILSLALETIGTPGKGALRRFMGRMGRRDGAPGRDGRSETDLRAFCSPSVSGSLPRVIATSPPAGLGPAIASFVSSRSRFEKHWSGVFIFTICPALWASMWTAPSCRADHACP